MLNLPASTEIRRIIPKKKIYEHFGDDMSVARRKTFDAEIARITVCNEISPASLNIAEGEEIQAFFVLHVQLKNQDYDQKNMAYVAKMFGQKIIMVLEYEGQQCLALWQTKLITTRWSEPETLTIALNGIDLDQVWGNVVAQIAGVELHPSETIDAAIAKAAQREKLEKEIARLEKKMWAEKQPKKKFEYMHQLKQKQKKLEGI